MGNLGDSTDIPIMDAGIENHSSEVGKSRQGTTQNLINIQSRGVFSSITGKRPIAT